MVGPIRRWIERRRRLRRLWQDDAQALIKRDERDAYYTAQRLAARCRAHGDKNSFFHWAKVAAEVARRSSITEMNYSVVETIVAEELDRADNPSR
jgi:hypothetical protein